MDNRPPPIETEDTICCDIKSNEVRRCYPFLPTTSSWSDHHDSVKQREHYLKVNDTIAYEKIKKRYPLFKPPHKITKIYFVDRIRYRIEETIRTYRENKKRK